MTTPNTSTEPTRHPSHGHADLRVTVPKSEEVSLAAQFIQNRATLLGPGKTINDFLLECRKVWNRCIDRNGSLEGYESTVKYHILPFFSGTAMRDWDTPLIIQFITYLDEKVALTAKLTPYKDGRKLSKVHKKKILAILSGICRLAITQGQAEKNPAKEYGRLLKEHSDTPSNDNQENHPRAKPIQKWKALTIEERDRALMAARQFLSLRYYAYFLFLAATGARPSEAAAIRWTRLDLEGKTTSGVPTAEIRTTIKRGGKHIGKTKSKRWRIVELISPLVEVLKFLYALLPPGSKKDEFVFRQHNGKVFSQAFRNMLWSVVLGLAGITRWLSVYSLRHTYASVLIHQGVSISIVSVQLGHYDDDVTRTTYLEWLPVKTNSELSRLNLKGL